MDNNGLTNDCEALLDAMADLGGDLNWDADTAMADWEGVTMSDGRRIGYLAEGRRPGRLGLRCARSPGHADCAEPAQQLAER